MSQNSEAAKPHTNGSPLSNAEIALLCDIGTSSPAEADADKTRSLQRMIAEGFVEPAGETQAPAKYLLTAKAQKLLAERGVGLNEA